MRRRLIVLRPEPGNAATCARIAAAGGEPVSLPLFVVRPIEWAPPDPAAFDALLLTSANAVRHAGPNLARYATLPVVAVGAATARAAADAGLRVAAVGAGDAGEAAALLASIGAVRPLHLAGREHRAVAGVRIVTVYASDPAPIDAAAVATLAGGAALIHSARAGERLAELVAPTDRGHVVLTGISAAALARVGGGWAAVRVAAMPTDAALVAAALSIDPPPGAGDKAG